MPAPMPVSKRRIAVVVMGVSGSGKSTVAAGIANALGLHFIDGDSLHSPENVAKMHAGIALRDEDRWPWLDRIGRRLADAAAWPRGVVIACSALRRVYRDRIRAGAPGV
ncbi:MAG TPA: gluconokinase, GntK/IdnK-type, partial [Caldimonas sp.]